MTFKKQNLPLTDITTQYLIENSCISITDNKGAITFVSDSFCRLCGYSRDELVGKNHSILSSGTHSKSFFSNLWKTIASGETWRGEICNVRKNGQTYWIDRIINPLINERGETDYYLATSYDITQRKQSANKLRHRAHHQGLVAILGQLSLNNISLQIFLEQTIAAITSAMEMNMGMFLEIIDRQPNMVVRAAAGLVYGKPDQTIIPIEDDNLLGFLLKQNEPTELQTLFKSHQVDIPCFFEKQQMNTGIALPIRGESDSYGLMILLSNQHTFINSEEAHFFQSVCNLVSSSIIKNRIDNKLKKEKNLISKYINVADVMIIVMDDNGNITLSNEKASNILGESKNSLIGKNWFDNFSLDEHREKIKDNFQRVLRGEQVADDIVDIEGNITPIITRKNDIRLIKWNSTVIYDDETDRYSLLSSGEDITDHHQAEQEKQALQQELYHAQRMESLGILASGIAHDFNNILASILGFTELSIEKFSGINDEKLTDYLEEIKNSSLKAKNIITQMQSFHIPGKTETKTVLLPPLIENTLKMMRSAIPPSIDLQQQIDTGVPAVSLDPEKINQLLMNLILNARNAMPGTGSLSISIHQIKDADEQCISCEKIIQGHQVCLTVEDSGKGLGKQALATIFNKTSTDPVNESAQTLLSADQIIHHSNGHLSIDSEPDRGTAVKVFFEVSNNHTNGLSNIKDTKSLIDTKLTDARIMIVDDENSIATYLGEIFNFCNISNQVFTDATKALDAFLNDPDEYDLILTDHSMPSLSGDQLARKVLEKRANMPIILFSGQSDFIDEDTIKDINIRGFIKKPVQTHVLLECVYKLLTEPDESIKQIH